MCVISSDANFVSISQHGCFKPMITVSKIRLNTNATAFNKLCIYVAKNSTICWAAKNRSSVLMVFQIYVQITDRIKQTVLCPCGSLSQHSSPILPHCLTFSGSSPCILRSCNFKKRGHLSLWSRDLFGIPSVLQCHP